MKKEILYGISMAAYVPALLTNFYGNVYLSFWDFYESTFILIAMLDYIPLMALVLLLESKSFLVKLGFAVTAVWMLLMAMPDVFLSYLPIVQQYYFADYRAYWFGYASGFLLCFNIFFFATELIECRKKG